MKKIVDTNKDLTIKQGMLNYIEYLKLLGCKPPFRMMIRSSGYDETVKDIRAEFSSDEELDK